MPKSPSRSCVPIAEVRACAGPASARTASVEHPPGVPGPHGCLWQGAPRARAVGGVSKPARSATSTPKPRRAGPLLGRAQSRYWAAASWPAAWCWWREPGVGKSTLLMHAAAQVAPKAARCCTYPGRSRRSRSACAAQARGARRGHLPAGRERPRSDLRFDLGGPAQLVNIDSIQTVMTPASKAARSVTQVRESPPA